MQQVQSFSASFYTLGAALLIEKMSFCLGIHNFFITIYVFRSHLLEACFYNVSNHVSIQFDKSNQFVAKHSLVS
jgi:hypothetical protein